MSERSLPARLRVFFVSEFELLVFQLLLIQLTLNLVFLNSRDNDLSNDVHIVMVTIIIGIQIDHIGEEIYLLV